MPFVPDKSSKFVPDVNGGLEKLIAERDMKRMADPTGSFMDNTLAGAGKAFTDIGRGAGQMLGMVPQSDIDESKKRDKALMNTGGGVAGNILGNAAAFAPTAFIPGANTYTGAALAGGVAGALQPTATGESRMANTGLGAGGGVAGQFAGNMLGRAIKPVSSSLSPEAEALAQKAGQEGIPLTAGQRTGSRPLQTVESVMENLPLTAGPQAAQREAQQRAFTAAALRRAGMTGDVAGAAELGAQKSALGSTMSGIADRNSIDFNRGLTNKLADITDDASKHLPEEAAKKISSTVDKILAQVDQAGTMSGAHYQGWREPLRGLASEGDAAARYAGQIRKALDSEFSSQISGAEGDAFKTASRQYANLKTIMQAAGGPGNAAAVDQIAPTQLSAALRQSMGKEGMALGRGDMNELSNIGTKFVREQINNSGTPQRQLAQSLLTSGFGAGAGGGTAYAMGKDPMTGAAIGAGMGAGALATPRLIQMAMNSGAGQHYLTEGIMNLTQAERAALAAALRTGAIGGMATLEASK